MDVRNLFKQFIKFGVVGFCNTLLSFAITYGTLFLCGSLSLFSDNLDKQMLLSSFVGFTLSFLNSYYWNNKLVFNKTSSMFCAFAKSYLCYAISWAISYALTYISSNYLGVSKLFVPVLSLVLTVPLNFLANKFWAFR